MQFGGNLTSWPTSWRGSEMSFPEIKRADYISLSYAELEKCMLAHAIDRQGFDAFDYYLILKERASRAKWARALINAIERSSGECDLMAVVGELRRQAEQDEKEGG